MLAALAALLAASGAWTLDTVAQGGPDLTVGGIEVVQAPDTGGARLEATLSNDASVAAEDVRVAFRADGQRMGTLATLERIDAGANATATSDVWWPMDGDHNVTAVVDPADRIAETDETDNERSLTVTVEQGEPADLAVQALEVTPEDPATTDTITIRARIVNHGPGSISQVPVAVLVDGEPLGSPALIGSLSENGTVTVSRTSWQPEPGNHTLRVTVDPNHQVQEPNETDNDGTQAVGVRAPGPEDLPDLTIVSIELSPEARAGEEITIRTVVRNVGNATSERTTLRLVADGTALTNATRVVELAPGQSLAIAVDGVLPSDGEATLEATLDPADAVQEGDEGNNEATRTIELAASKGSQGLESTATGDEGAPVEVETLELDPSEPGPGDAVRFEVTWQNTGNETLDGAGAQLLVDGEVVHTWESLPSIAPGEATATSTDAWNATPGDHTVAVNLTPEDGEARTLHEASFQVEADQEASVPGPSVVLLLVLVGGLACAVGRRRPG